MTKWKFAVKNIVTRNRKTVLETRAVLLVFSFELEISGVVVQEKMAAFTVSVKMLLVKMTLRLF